jgi:cyclin B
MIENNSLQENLAKTEKTSLAPATRPPLQNLYHENVAVPLQINNSNPQLVKIYFNEIFNFLESTEENFQIKSDYFLLHTEINHTSRAFLIDWLVTLHSKFRLLQETLYISVNLVDRYLSKRMVTKKQLQLVGVTAMFIAAKYEEIYPPNARDFLLATEQAYTKQHLVKMEVDMLKVMNFQITFPTPWRFMEKHPEVSSGGHNLLAEYLLELGQVEFVIVKYKPSMQAASVIYLANLLAGKGQNWKIEDLQGSEIHDCVKDFLKVFKSAASHPLTSVRDKYQKKKLDIVKIEQESL